MDYNQPRAAQQQRDEARERGRLNARPTSCSAKPAAGAPAQTDKPLTRKKSKTKKPKARKTATKTAIKTTGQSGAQASG